MTMTVPKKNKLEERSEVQLISKLRLHEIPGVQPYGRMNEDACVYPVGLKSCSRKYETSADKMMDVDVANPLRMLSAYFMTTATTNPPPACRQCTGFKSMLHKSWTSSFFVVVVFKDLQHFQTCRRTTMHVTTS